VDRWSIDIGHRQKQPRFRAQKTADDLGLRHSFALADCGERRLFVSTDAEPDDFSVADALAWHGLVLPHFFKPKPAKRARKRDLFHKYRYPAKEEIP
jgi:hypothetical protein